MNFSRSSLFPPNSRYHNTETSTLKTQQGKTVVFLKRRFLPPTESLSLLQMHYVVEGDRLDNISALYMGDASLFWRICDANNATNPPLLTDKTGRQLRITMPQGIPEIPNAIG